MQLTTGIKAPNFITVDVLDRGIRLDQYQGKKVLLSFFRNVSCPFCNLRVHYLSGKREEFEAAGLQMIFVFESESKQILNSAHHRNLAPIPIISDPKHFIYSQYGVSSSKLKALNTFLQKSAYKDLRAARGLDFPSKKEAHTDPNLIPADFLIDENGIIQTAYYGTNLRDHLDIISIKKFATNAAFHIAS